MVTNTSNTSNTSMKVISLFPQTPTFSSSSEEYKEYLKGEIALFDTHIKEEIEHFRSVLRGEPTDRSIQSIVREIKFSLGMLQHLHKTAREAGFDIRSEN